MSDCKSVVPEKSSCDRREYRVITLENKLEVLLCSDHEADKAGAAMDIHVGSFSDPDNVPGIAHFCEHMLFLGTEKVHSMPFRGVFAVHDRSFFFPPPFSVVLLLPFRANVLLLLPLPIIRVMVTSQM